MRVEQTIYHPLVKHWLEARNYSYAHEYTLEYKRPDFVAYPTENEVLIIECKTHVYDTMGAQMAVSQIMRYYNEYNRHCRKGDELVRLMIASEFTLEGMQYVIDNGIEILHMPVSLFHCKYAREYERDTLEIEPGELIVRAKETV